MIRMQQLIQKIPVSWACLRTITKQSVEPEILRADRRIQIGPRGMNWIGWRMQRTRSDMAKAARHSHAIRPNQFRIIVIAGICIIPLRIPSLRGGLVEIGVWKQAKPDDPGRFAIVRADRQYFAAADGFASRAHGDAGIFFLIREWVGRAVRTPYIKP